VHAQNRRKLAVVEEAGWVCLEEGGSERRQMEEGEEELEKIITSGVARS
jgi:hypothetical protein